MFEGTSADGKQVMYSSLQFTTRKYGNTYLLGGPCCALHTWMGNSAGGAQQCKDMVALASGEGMRRHWARHVNCLRLVIFQASLAISLSFVLGSRKGLSQRR
jgi:hypothetical protein